MPPAPVSGTTWFLAERMDTVRAIEAERPDTGGPGLGRCLLGDASGELSLDRDNDASQQAARQEDGYQYALTEVTGFDPVASRFACCWSVLARCGASRGVHAGQPIDPSVRPTPVTRAFC